jgi:hypothetical protein
MVECVDELVTASGACSSVFSEALDIDCGPHVDRFARECLAVPPPIPPSPQSCMVGATVSSDQCSVEAACSDGNGYRVDCKISSGIDLICTCWDDRWGNTGSFKTSSPFPSEDYCGRLALEACGFPVAL